MKNIEYNEPEFRVVATSTEDVITTSGGGETPAQSNNYTAGQFESGPINFTI